MSDIRIVPAFGGKMVDLPVDNSDDAARLESSEDQ